MKSIGINHTTDMKDAYTENQKTQLTEAKDLNKSRDISHTRIGRLNIVDTSVLSKLTYRFHTFPETFL